MNYVKQIFNAIEVREMEDLEKKFDEMAKKLDKEFHRGFRFGMVFATIIWVITLITIFVLTR